MGACCSSSKKQYSKSRKCPRVSVTVGEPAACYVINEIGAKEEPANKNPGPLQSNMDYLSVERYKRGIRSFDLPRVQNSSPTSARVTVTQRASVSSRLGLKPTLAVLRVSQPATSAESQQSLADLHQKPVVSSQVQVWSLTGESRTYNVLDNKRETVPCTYYQTKPLQTTVYSVACYDREHLKNFALSKAYTVYAFVKTEAEQLAEVSHPHVLSPEELIGSPLSSQVYLVSEQVLPIDAPLKPKLARNYFRQLIKAVEYLHTNKRVVHRAISQDSVMQTYSGTLKLAHFHLSRPLTSDLLGKQAVQQDLRDCGRLLYYLLTAKCSYSREDSLDWCSASLRSLLEPMLDLRTETSIELIKANEWFAV